MLEKGQRIYKTLKDVEMDILGDIRKISEVKVSYTRDSQGKVQRCMSFDEYNRISDDIHHELKHKRRVYYEHY